MPQVVYRGMKSDVQQCICTSISPIEYTTSIVKELYLIAYQICLD